MLFTEVEKAGGRTSLEEGDQKFNLNMLILSSLLDVQEVMPRRHMYETRAQSNV